MQTKMLECFKHFFLDPNPCVKTFYQNARTHNLVKGFKYPSRSEFERKLRKMN